MQFPKLKPLQTLQRTLEVFGGYNCRERIADGEFSQMRNMTSDHYPVLAPREKRGSAAAYPAGMTGVTVNNGICYTLGNCFYLPGGTPVDLELTEGDKQLVSMGACVIILPDKKWINVAACLDALEKGHEIPTDAYGDVEAACTGTAQIELCREDGTEYAADEITREKPSDPADGQLWIDTDESPSVLKRWTESSKMWTVVNNVFTKITMTALEENPFAPEDTVEISAEGNGLIAKMLKHVLGKRFVAGAGSQYIIIDSEIGFGGTAGVSGAVLTVEKRMPDLDLVVESGNRLWGCKFGSTDKGFLNEIYASKLGDFKNWNSFRGISTDSYVASIGADGPFTGAASFLGRPVFFKENAMIEVSGGYPAQYRVQTTPCDGVRAGCEKSTALVDNVLYYRSCNGICAYDGSLPVPVGQALGQADYRNAVAGGCGSKYYISMEDEAGWHLFVYDAARRLWHREDELRAKSFCTWRNRLFCLDADGSFFPMTDPEGTETVPWMATTGPMGLSLPGSKYISRLNLRLSVAPGATVRLSARYDHSPRWEPLYAITGTDLRSFTVPIRPKRCDHMMLRLEGTGMVKVYSLTEYIEKGSDVL